MEGSRTRNINRLAVAILQELELMPPVDVERAVELLGGELSLLGDESETEAMIEKKENGFVIRIKRTRDETEQRRRFSIAHELGHLFLHMGYLSTDDRWTRGNDYQDDVGRQ
jgi:hypothetical protein